MSSCQSCNSFPLHSVQPKFAHQTIANRGVTWELSFSYAGDCEIHMDISKFNLGVKGVQVRAVLMLFSRPCAAGGGVSRCAGLLTGKPKNSRHGMKSFICFGWGNGVLENTLKTIFRFLAWLLNRFIARALNSQGPASAIGVQGNCMLVENFKRNNSVRVFITCFRLDQQPGLAILKAMYQYQSVAMVWERKRLLLVNSK